MPPFRIVLGDEEAEALSFDQLRREVLRLASKGVDVNPSRASARWTPTSSARPAMDPARRTLAQVTMEDAVEADRIFSMLMGDQVERGASSSRPTPVPSSTWTSDHMSTSDQLTAATSSPAGSRRRCALRISTTRCRSSSGARCPTCATA